ncbi:MAG TPA: hypothetical protein VMS94_05800 [Acidobacteriota bacterium]|nr:hypothetical protein [Acidobacteriota bacterium]
MNIASFLSGAFAGILGDYVGYVMIDALSKTTPGWSPYGWGLYVAFNGAILLWLKRALGE